MFQEQQLDWCAPDPGCMQSTIAGFVSSTQRVMIFMSILTGRARKQSSMKGGRAGGGRGGRGGPGGRGAARGGRSGARDAEEEGGRGNDRGGNPAPPAAFHG